MAHFHRFLYAGILEIKCKNGRYVTDALKQVLHGTKVVCITKVKSSNTLF